MPQSQFHNPISPTPSFFTMVHMLAESVRSFAGAFSDAKIVVSVGEDVEPFDIDRARPELAPYGIEWRWRDRDLFRRHSYFATGLDRWANPFECDYVIMADADILILGPLDELTTFLPTSRSIAGVIATKPPFTGLRGRASAGRIAPTNSPQFGRRCHRMDQRDAPPRSGRGEERFTNFAR